MEKTEIGFDFEKKKWFTQSFTETRWLINQNLVNDAKINLSKVICDTYSWADNNNPLSTHGRLRLFENNETEIKSNMSYADSINVKGKDKLEFKNYKTDSAKIIYHPSKMNWSIILEDGTELITNDIKGLIDADFSQNPVFMTIKKADILFSWLVTIINSNMVVK